MGLCAGREEFSAVTDGPVPGLLSDLLQPAESSQASALEISCRRPNSRENSLRAKCIFDYHAGSIRNCYTMDDSKLLGKGSFGSVTIGVHKCTNVKKAIKILPISNPRQIAGYRHEVDVMKSMDHPNIIHLSETFEGNNNSFLVMELCSGGELFDRIVNAGRFTEKDGAAVMKQMLSAVCYMQKRGVVHRDLKPENFLFSDNGPIHQSTLKVIDFGLARKFQEGVAMRTMAGTPFYVAPEVLQGKYGEGCDYWSCGVIMFTMLGGYPPFYGQSDKEVLQKVRKGKFSFSCSQWKQISEDAKNLIRALLRFRPERRLTAEQALEDCWIRDCAPSAKAVSLSDGLVENLRNFQSQNKLKKAALNVIAAELHCSEIAELTDTFKALDTNSDGFLTVEELQAGMAKAKADCGSVNVEAILRGVDAGENGVIDYTEFLAAAMDKRLYIQRDVCWAAFSWFDQDGSGTISLEELKQVLGTDEVGQMLEGRTAQDLLKEVDINGDGEIDFEEFMCMMQGSSGTHDSIARASTMGSSGTCAPHSDTSSECSEGGKSPNLCSARGGA